MWTLSPAWWHQAIMHFFMRTSWIWSVDSPRKFMTNFSPSSFGVHESYSIQVLQTFKMYDHLDIAIIFECIRFEKFDKEFLLHVMCAILYGYLSKTECVIVDRSWTSKKRNHKIFELIKHGRQEVLSLRL